MPTISTESQATMVARYSEDDDVMRGSTCAEQFVLRAMRSHESTEHLVNAINRDWIFERKNQKFPDNDFTWMNTYIGQERLVANVSVKTGRVSLLGFRILNVPTSRSAEIEITRMLEFNMMHCGCYTLNEVHSSNDTSIPLSLGDGRDEMSIDFTYCCFYDVDIGKTVTNFIYSNWYMIVADRHSTRHLYT